MTMTTPLATDLRCGHCGESRVQARRHSGRRILICKACAHYADEPTMADARREFQRQGRTTVEARHA